MMGLVPKPRASGWGKRLSPLSFPQETLFPALSPGDSLPCPFPRRHTGRISKQVCFTMAGGSFSAISEHSLQPWGELAPEPSRCRKLSSAQRGYPLWKLLTSEDACSAQQERQGCLLVSGELRCPPPWSPSRGSSHPDSQWAPLAPQTTCGRLWSFSKPIT